MANQSLKQTPQDIFDEILEGEIYKDLVLSTENGTPFALAFRENNHEAIRTIVQSERKKRVDEYLTDAVKSKYGESAQIVATYSVIEKLREKNKDYYPADIFDKEMRLRAEDFSK